MTPKIGRPKAENPKAVYCNIRIDTQTQEKLKNYCKKNNITKGEAVRRGIELLLGQK